MAIISRYLNIDGLPVLDPGLLRESNELAGAPIEFWGRANSITSDIGKEPGVAWLLVPRSTAAIVAGTTGINTRHTITWIDGSSSTQFREWVVASANAVGPDGDGAAAFLIELRDIRQILKGSGAVTRRYNITDPMPEGTHTSLRRDDPDTLNGGAQWTWQTMLADVWTFLPGIAGTVPTLTWTPPHKPQSWRFDGVNAWDAVFMILDACQSTLACNPMTGAISLVALGTPQTGLSAALTALSTKLLMDWQSVRSLGLSQYPAQIRVLFRGRTRTPNTVEQLDQDWHEWQAINTATGLTGASGGRAIQIRSDLFDERDNEQNTLNQAELDATAAAISARAILRYQISGNDRRVEASGIDTSISLGTEVHRLSWRDFGDDDGCRTEIWGMSKWGTATDGVTKRAKHTARLAIFKLTQDLWSEDNGWAYMPDCEVVRYFSANNSYSSNVANETTQDLYHPTGYPDSVGSAVRTYHQSSGFWPAKHGNGDFVWATWNDISERWELLAPYEDHWRFKLQGSVSVGGSATAVLRIFDGSTWIDTTVTFTVWDASEQGPFTTGDMGVAKYFADSRRWEILFAGSGPLWAEAILAADLCPADDGGSGSGNESETASVEDARYLPGCGTFTPTTVLNPFLHAGPAGSKVLMIRRQCDGGDEEWLITAVELRSLCVMVGIEDRDGGMVYAGLKTRAQWCPADEPTTACELVLYHDCNGNAIALDTSWTFDPLYVCNCGTEPPP